MRSFPRKRAYSPHAASSLHHRNFRCPSGTTDLPDTLNRMAPAKALRGGMALETQTERRNETSTRKPLPRSGGNPPARKGLTHHRKRALAGDSEMTPSSVGSELQSRVIEPRKKVERGSLRGCDSGGHAEAPQWSGAEVRPGSKSRAKPQVLSFSKGSIGVFREAGNRSEAEIDCRGQPEGWSEATSKPPVSSEKAGSDHPGIPRSKIGGGLSASGRQEQKVNRGIERRA